MKAFTSSYTFFLIFTILSVFILSAFTDTTTNNKATIGGELSFTVRTVTAGGNYAPKHVLAIWVEYQDDFVKSRKVMANNRIQYLYTWKAASNFNVVDAITGPTINSHQTQTVAWDCKDLSGNIVPDGDYVVWVEFTEKHGQGPLYSITFTKGPNSQLLTPPDETYFKDIVLSFTPLISDFSANETEVCEGETLTFSDESENATSWEWDFGDDAFPATANTQGPHDVIYSSTGFKTVSLTINENVTETKQDYIEVALQPTADFIFGGNNLTVDFTNNSINATDYLWDFGDGNTSTEENPVHIYSSPGTYQVSLISSQANCSDDTIQDVTVPMVGIGEYANDELVRIFPNPNNGIFNVEIKNYKEVEEIRLLDLSGQTIKSISHNSINNSLISFDLETVVSGIYFLEVNTKTDKIIKRILVR